MQIYSTESNRKETFEPSELPVKFYVCGLTPKNEPHLGHARLFVVNDMIRRYLEYRGYPVKYVQNFTDIDDKTIAAGQREGISAFAAAQRYMDAYFRDMDRLNIRRADEFTYVTHFIPQIIEMVQGLIERAHAYVLDGDVYFSVPSFPDYGRLSGRDEEAMQAGARIEPDERKHDPRDFALWKSAKPGEPWWESPWGPGRPGWHIECSTMAMHALGEQIDIHGGGSDLIFPHHENEIAQSESFSGVKPFARYWVHTGMLSLPSATGGQEKMAHSGRFVTIKMVLESGVQPAALRTYLLGTHYHANLTYSEAQLRATVERWRRWVNTRETLERLLRWSAGLGKKGKTKPGEAGQRLDADIAQYRGAFIEAMDDDFNTSRALGVIDELVHRINDYAHSLPAEPTAAMHAALGSSLAALLEITDALGIELAEEAAPKSSEVDREAVERLVAARTDARKRRDFAESDRIRAELETTYNVVVRDTPQGPTWSLKD
jgi:cysteinyl-tRNA synthetase